VRLVATIIVNPKQRLLFAIERCTIILSRDVNNILPSFRLRKRRLHRSSIGVHARC